MIKSPKSQKECHLQDRERYRLNISNLEKAYIVFVGALNHTKCMFWKLAQTILIGGFLLLCWELYNNVLSISEIMQV
jgi:hypothetical protein